MKTVHLGSAKAILGLVSLLSLGAWTTQPASALEYACATPEPQKSGWPLSEAERAYVLKPEHERRPGRELNQHKPALWPVVPSACCWGGTSWLDTHASLVKVAQASRGPIDVLLVGDSITMQWGEAWPRHFPGLKTVNIGIGGDKTQNVLWRLDHGGVEGLEPRVIVLLIGNNNMFFTPETGVEAASQGIQVCADNLREKFPKAGLIVVKIFPAHAPGNPFYEDIKKTNAALDALKLDSDPRVTVLDLWADMANADGTLKAGLFTPDNIHLTPAGYAAYAARLKPVLEAMLSGKPVPTAPREAARPPPPPETRRPVEGEAAPSRVPQRPAAPVPDAGSAKPVLIYPYAPYNEGKMDPQLTGWPLTDAEKAWVTKGEYTRKPGHEVQKHLPEMWFVTPTAGRWGKDSEENVWVAHHATCVEKVRAMTGGIDVALLGDSITQGWGGGWDGAPFNAAWQEQFGALKAVNLGIGGDRIENVLWRLDHGALDGASPNVIVLMIGVNNAPLVFANGVPAASAAQGIKRCVENLRLRCPKAQVVLVRILPAFDPAKEAGKAAVDINAAVDALKLDSDSHVQILDLWSEFTNADGTLKTALYSDGHLHLSPAGYEVFASKLRPVVERVSAKP
jgi:lysophospholipase L1-like esterase